MRILYVSALASKRMVNSIHNRTGGNPGYAAQKFSRLVVKGLILNGVSTTAFSNPPITREDSNKLWINLGEETEDLIKYKYIPFLNIPIIKHFCIFVYTFFYVFFWGLINKKDKAIICDVLSISSCFAAFLASKIIGLRRVAVVTDIYSQMVGERSHGLTSLIKKLAGVMQKRYSTSFTHYVLLTEAMNKLVNPHHHPYIVMEGLCDNEDVPNPKLSPNNDGIISMLYAGGIEEKYGIGALVEGFRRIPRNDIRLILYGHGTYVDNLKAICKEDNRIDYRGIASNEEIVEEEIKATVLVNPRFTSEELTMFSFPSKNMEYMASGTALLTTELPGMPKEYYPYVFLFNQGESPDGFAKVLEEVISLPSECLIEKGKLAREFVINNKNNIIQTRRIIQLLNY